ncbi:amino acid permease [Anaerorhabdus furcosa]|uniref:Glutamate:gamma-aminobutyrate antiporter n=1 Tax=Anaerorhabdus furcosa TaxID=118967 RepID=A0A1T4NV44_9FIRM|nr:amino acid permease [Anaerorhabdus furcosa]SJZ83073.1 glutamate:gamma-aminobutyrate antiporter [Anaerorhabdus furcosa]
MSNKKNLTLFGFFALTATMVMTVYEYPSFASSGFSLVFYLIVGGFFWFLPVALCAAEMATVKGWDTGGVYAWSGNLLGEKWGFANIFFQWFQGTVGFVTMIYFILSALSYVFNFEPLNSNPMVRFLGVVLIFWIVTLSQFKGTKISAKISRYGFIIGILIPALVLFGLTIAYFLTGGKSLLTFDFKTFIPDFSKVNTLVVFVSFILAYAGIEASASHANEMKNVKRDYPIAVIGLVILAILLNTMGGLSIGSVVPADKLGLSTGVLQGFKGLLAHFGTNFEWIVRVIAILISMGVLAETTAWIVGPSWGMQVAGKTGLLPKSLSKTNKDGVPTQFLILQGVIVTIWAAILTFGGNGNSNLSFFAGMSLTVIIYALAYIIFFVAYLVLVTKHDSIERAFRISKSKIVQYFFGISGLVFSIIVFFISFIPPSQLHSSTAQREYFMILIVSFILVVFVPFIIYQIMRKKNPLPKGAKMPTLEEDETHGN